MATRNRGSRGHILLAEFETGGTEALGGEPNKSSVYRTKLEPQIKTFGKVLAFFKVRLTELSDFRGNV